MLLVLFLRKYFSNLYTFVQKLFNIKDFGFDPHCHGGVICFLKKYVDVLCEGLKSWDIMGHFDYKIQIDFEYIVNVLIIYFWLINVVAQYQEYTSPKPKIVNIVYKSQAHYEIYQEDLNQ